MKILFSKISNNHDRLRDDLITGECDSFNVEINQSFFMTGKARDSLDKGAFRQVMTSPVKAIIQKTDDLIIFETSNGSIYSIKKMIE